MEKYYDAQKFVGSHPTILIRHGTDNAVVQFRMQYNHVTVPAVSHEKSEIVQFPPMSWQRICNFLIEPII